MANLNENVQVELFAFDKGKKTRDIKAISSIVEVVKKDVLSKDNIEYMKVKVKVKNNKEGKPEYLVLYKLRKDSYMADVSQVKIDSNYTVKEISNNYNDEGDFDEVEEEEENNSYDTYDFVFATPVSYIATALDAINNLHNMAIAAGYRSKKLLDSEATVANYKHYLTSGLKGFVNVGHGSPSLIVLDDGRLDSHWFTSLGGTSLNPTVVYFNSCQVFNAPLQPAVMHSGARTFIGGITNLLIGPSERVCKCFWQDILLNHKHMGEALHDCEISNYPNQNSHGISGDLGAFKKLVIRPTLLLRDPRCRIRRTLDMSDLRCVRPTILRHDHRCEIIRRTLSLSDPRCIRKTFRPGCLIRETFKPGCFIPHKTLNPSCRITMVCGIDIPDINDGMPLPTREYNTYYDQDNDDESWYEEDNYTDWDMGDD